MITLGLIALLTCPALYAWWNATVKGKEARLLAERNEEVVRERDYLKEQLGRYERVDGAPFRSQVPKENTVVEPSGWMNGGPPFPPFQTPLKPLVPLRSTYDSAKSLKSLTIQSNDLQTFSVSTTYITNEVIDTLNDLNATLETVLGDSEAKITIGDKSRLRKRGK